jgi:hypothetical protein
MIDEMLLSGTSTLADVSPEASGPMSQAFAIYIETMQLRGQVSAIRHIDCYRENNTRTPSPAVQSKHRWRLLLRTSTIKLASQDRTRTVTMMQAIDGTTSYIASPYSRSLTNLRSQYWINLLRKRPKSIYPHDIRRHRHYQM